MDLVLFGWLSFCVEKKKKFCKTILTENTVLVQKNQEKGKRHGRGVTDEESTHPLLVGRGVRSCRGRKALHPLTDTTAHGHPCQP